jgi:hypothetical protein
MEETQALTVKKVTLGFVRLEPCAEILIFSGVEMIR